MFNVDCAYNNNVIGQTVAMYSITQKKIEIKQRKFIGIFVCHIFHAALVNPVYNIWSTITILHKCTSKKFSQISCPTEKCFVCPFSLKSPTMRTLMELPFNYYVLKELCGIFLSTNRAFLWWSGELSTFNIWQWGRVQLPATTQRQLSPRAGIKGIVMGGGEGGWG